MSPLTGFLGGGVIGALAMDLIGVQRVRGRDLATGIVLGAATGLAALFLYLDTTRQATTGATQQILFGSIFTIDSLDRPRRGRSAASAHSGWSPSSTGRLLLSSVSPEAAAARGVPVRLVGLALHVALARGGRPLVAGHRFDPLDGAAHRARRPPRCG